MSTGNALLHIRDLEVDVSFKDIKHLHVGVYPPAGRVRVAAPRHLGEEQVRLAVIKRWAWIQEQRTRLQAAERQSERAMVTGESHYTWGIRRRLRVIDKPGKAEFALHKGWLVLAAPDGSSPDDRRRALDRWYRDQMRQAVPPLIARWEPVVGVEVSKWSVRHMKTKWGSCNPSTGHISFNTELAKKDPAALEYIVVHEMTHYLEAGHGERFTRLMDDLMPGWRRRRDLLNAAPLAHEIW
jgi:predicted metal-dependent hydrolase